jgi:hypothetical protein
MSEIHLLYSPHLNIKYMRAKERERERESSGGTVSECELGITEYCDQGCQSH